MEAAVLVPVKAFHAAKLRLAPALSPSARDRLAREMAGRVVRAAGSLPVTVVCDDAEVRSWAEAHGANVAWTPGLGLNGAVAAGVAALAAQGAERIVVAHADLPLATGLDHVVGENGVRIVADRWNDGTNVIAIPARSGFEFSYGPRSFDRHCAQARHLGLSLEVIDDHGLAWDVDLPDDLRLPDGEDLAAGAPR